MYDTLNDNEKFEVWYLFMAFTGTVYTMALPANILISIITNSVSKLKLTYTL